jgi:hypothetical protein
MDNGPHFGERTDMGWPKDIVKKKDVKREKMTII